MAKSVQACASLLLRAEPQSELRKNQPLTSFGPCTLVFFCPKLIR